MYPRNLFVYFGAENWIQDHDYDTYVLFFELYPVSQIFIYAYILIYIYIWFYSL